MKLTKAQQEIVDALCSDLPARVLIVGGRQTGKTVMLKAIRDHYDVLDTDYLPLRVPTTESVSKSLELAAYSPVGPFRLVTADVNSDTDVALVAPLLKSPDDVRVILLVNSDTDYESLSGSCRVYHLRSMSSDEVKESISLSNRDSATLSALSRISTGGVPSMRGLADAAECKPLVVKALTSFLTRDRESLEEVADDWTGDHTSLLVQWCFESASGKWRYFSAEEVAVESKDLPLTILSNLRHISRPKLVVRGSLVSAWKEFNEHR